MADNSRNRKKTLIVSMLAFLFIGGGVFLFFIIQGSDDLTGARKKNSFSYGFGVRNAVLPLFKRLGISTYEDDIVRPRKGAEENSLGISAESAASADVSDWMADNSAGQRSPSGGSSGGRPTSVPKMSRGAGSRMGGSGGGTKSSGGVSRFEGGTDSGNTKISAKVSAAAGGPADKGTMGALKNARAMLREGLRSDSAMTAKSKWGQSFGVGAGGGKSGDLAYAKTGLVKLDHIKSGEISNLKLDNKGSLKAAEVSPPEKDSDGTAKALNADTKTKKDMAAEMKKEVAKDLTDAAGKALTPSQGEGGSPSDSSPDSGSCDLNDGPPTSLCSTALSSDNTMSSDTGVEYKQVEANANGKVYEVTYNGEGPGITDQYKDQQVNYSDTARIQVDSNGNITILGWNKPVETPIGN